MRQRYYNRRMGRVSSHMAGGPSPEILAYGWRLSLEARPLKHNENQRRSQRNENRSLISKNR